MAYVEQINAGEMTVPVTEAVNELGCSRSGDLIMDKEVIRRRGTRSPG